MHFLYQFSLQFFLEIFTNVLLNNPRLSGVTDHATRLSIITSDLFQVELLCLLQIQTIFVY